MKNDSVFKYCLFQVLEYEAQTRKHKKILSCEECIFRKKCKKYDSKSLHEDNER